MNQQISCEPENDVTFTFLKDERTIKCSRLILCEISPVFQVMFSATWFQNKSSVELNDAVTFDQYETFNLFVEIVSGKLQISSLDFEHIAAVYYYVDKYQVSNIADAIIKFLAKTMRISVSEFRNLVEFAQTYQLKDFLRQLDNQVEPILYKKDSIKFFELAKKFKMDMLKERIIQRLKSFEPRGYWTPEVTRSVIRALQKENRQLECKISASQKISPPDLSTKPKITTKGNPGTGGRFRIVIDKKHLKSLNWLKTV